MGSNVICTGPVAADGIYHYIYGNVLDEDGHPVVGLDIVGDDFVGDVFPTVTTDENGYYIFDAGVEGNYRVTLSCEQLNAQGYQCVDPVDKTVSGEYNELDFTVQTTTSALPLRISNISLPMGNVTMPYTVQLNATNGQAPYMWQMVSNSPPLPPGLSLGVDGLISGTPKTNSTYAFKVQVTDAASTITNKVMFITVNRQPTLLTPVWRTNRFTVRLFGGAGQNYTIQTTTNCNSTNWNTLLVTNNPDAGSFIVTDPNATGSQRFYRVLIGP